jgi:hypothetical protein
MNESANSLRWNGSPGHYEVYYLSVTEPRSAVGLWIRYTMIAPCAGKGPPTCALWLMAMDPRAKQPLLARKATLAISELHATTEPFSLSIGQAFLDDHAMIGSMDDVSWKLHWEPRLPAYQHVHPLLRRARVAQTVLELPHADLAISGTVSLGARTLELSGARGGQAHLWGIKHAARWAWVHCNDLSDINGEAVSDTFVDGVSVYVSRLGRQVGPSTPVVGRFVGEDFCSTSPVRVLANKSQFGLAGWQLLARQGARRVQIETQASEDHLVGVTYHDPDGQRAYCYNTEVASMRVGVWDRVVRSAQWKLRQSLLCDGRAHFEYAQREPVNGLQLLLN